MKELLFMNPVFKEMLWGGNRMKAVYSYPIPSDLTGECWAISAHPNGICTINNGQYQGKKLNVLWENHKELFGNSNGKYGEQFPLLVKIIDAKQDLSIQVHPDDAYAGINEKGSLGKTECWYILDADPNATIVIGHYAKDKSEVKSMIENKDWKNFIREIPVEKGQFFQIDPGCVHAIKGGTLILEVQQSSDITYRVYDYDRLTDGKPRELHVKQSIDVINAPFNAEELHTRKSVEGDVIIEHLITCPFYTVEKYDVNGNWSIDFQKDFVNVDILEGSGTIDGYEIKKGDHFIIPYEYGTCEINGTISMICSWIDEK